MELVNAWRASEVQEMLVVYTSEPTGTSAGQYTIETLRPLLNSALPRGGGRCAATDLLQLSPDASIVICFLLIGAALAQPVPDPQYPCDPCADPCDPCPEPEPDPCDPSPPPCPDPCDPQPCEPCQEQGVVQIQPCNPNEPDVNYVYGRAPYGSVLVKPGQIRFPRPAPIVVRPGTVRPPNPPIIYVKPAPVQPPTPAPIYVKPQPVQPPTPSPITVRPAPVNPPRPRPILVRPPPVVPPRIPSIKVQPQKVCPPTPPALVVQPPRLIVPQPPIICFKPNPTIPVRTCGCARVSLYNPCPPPPPPCPPPLPPCPCLL
ncbi:unnamed protein product [Pieris brassicae]|uniref:IGFBP N-terminal domain-containing protein n=1 Tax=Pieris brassicae TaxID=7116 RepID=A0A9P0TLZ7_PIEBR|nr:unnamed protein product [Pieris brassicae]